MCHWSRRSAQFRPCMVCSNVAHMRVTRSSAGKILAMWSTRDAGVSEVRAPHRALASVVNSAGQSTRQWHFRAWLLLRENPSPCRIGKRGSGPRIMVRKSYISAFDGLDTSQMRRGHGSSKCHRLVACQKQVPEVSRTLLINKLRAPLVMNISFPVSLEGHCTS